MVVIPAEAGIQNYQWAGLRIKAWPKLARGRRAEWCRMTVPQDTADKAAGLLPISRAQSNTNQQRLTTENSQSSIINCGALPPDLTFL